MDIMYGEMGKNTKGFGKITKWVAKATLSGQMEEGMKESMLMEKRKDLENLCGQMVDVTKGNGRTVNKMAEAFLFLERDRSVLVFGVMAKTFVGFVDLFILWVDKQW